MRYLYAMCSIVAALVVPGALAAQSADATASIEVVPEGTVVVTKVADLDFGAHPGCSPTATCDIRSWDISTAADWNIMFNRTDDYVIAFTLPSALSSASGAQVPISFGTASASSEWGTWDPAVPHPINALNGDAFFVSLGAPVGGTAVTGSVTVSLAGAQPGTYQGVITLTVAAL